MRAPRLTLFILSSASIMLAAVTIEACSDDATETPVGGGGSEAGSGNDAKTTRPDGSTDDDEDSGGNNNNKDAGNKDDGGGNTFCGPNNASKIGETCVGFGAKPETCDAGCNPFGYLCFSGGPPGFTNCHEMRVGGLGNTYCCSENKCVAEPDQDTQCLDAGAGKPHRFQCPPNENGSGNVAAPTGCVEHVSGGSAIEKFYCCP